MNCIMQYYCNYYANKDTIQVTVDGVGIKCVILTHEIKIESNQWLSLG